MGRIEKKKKEDDSNVSVGVNHCVDSSLSWPKCICDLEMDITRIRGALQTIASFRM